MACAYLSLLMSGYFPKVTDKKVKRSDPGNDVLKLRSLQPKPHFLFFCHNSLPSDKVVNYQRWEYERHNVQISRDIQTAAFKLITFSFQQQLPVPEKESHVRVFFTII